MLLYWNPQPEPPPVIAHPDACPFNQGSDARLKGLPLSANPYPWSERLRWRFWMRGWRHVHAFWGCGALWPVKPLPDLIVARY